MNIRSYRHWTPQLGQRVYLDPQATVIGRVVIGDDVSIWPATTVRGDVNDITIGARTSIQDGSVLHVASAILAGGEGHALVIGEDCTVGHNVILHACTVGRCCLIGMGAIVMDGAVIGDEAIIGAGSVVAPGKQVPSRTLWVGNPARQVRTVTEREVEYLATAAAHYVRLKDEYLAAG